MATCESYTVLETVSNVASKRVLFRLLEISQGFFIAHMPINKKSLERSHIIVVVSMGVGQMGRTVGQQ